jgi:hypothetical protein
MRVEEKKEGMGVYGKMGGCGGKERKGQSEA